MVNLFSSNGRPNPTLSGFGTIVSSLLLTTPEPNWICKVEGPIKRVANLLSACFSLSK